MISHSIWLASRSPEMGSTLSEKRWQAGNKIIHGGGDGISAPRKMSRARFIQFIIPRNMEYRSCQRVSALCCTPASIAIGSNLILTQCLRRFFRPFGLQRIVPQILAGVILGPSCMGKIPKFSETIFPVEGQVFIEALSKLGFVFFMFLTGVQMELSTIVKSGRKAWTIGLISVLIPIGLVTAVSSALDKQLPDYRTPAARAILGVQTLTPFAVIACLLIDLKIVNSELGRLTLASTLISDFLSSVFTTWLRFAYANWNKSEAIQSQILSIGFVLAILLIGRPLFQWIIKQTPEGKPVNGAYIILVSLTVLICSAISDAFGLQYQFGPFILGLTVPSGPPLGTTLVERLETLVSGFFAPLIVTSCGLQFNIFEMYDLEFLVEVWILLAGSLVLKLTSILLPTMLCDMPIRDGFVLSIIMSTQGIVELALYQNYFLNQTIDKETFASATMSVLIMDITSTRVVRSLYDFSKKYSGYQKRDILHVPANTELRVLACTYRQDDAVAAVRLLHVSCPTKQNPVALYVVHLVEIVGRAPPLIINHDLGQKASSTGNRSAKVVDIFRYLGEHNPGFISGQAFTAMSLPKFMKDDICSIAFDKVTSLVILPFHRKWNQQGKLVFDSRLMRSNNIHVLVEAPCSVGIFIDRYKMRQPSHGSSSHTVGIIFLGGDDDREAVAYGLRMANSPHVQLSVIRLMARDYTIEDEWETVLNTESMKTVKYQAMQQENIMYREVMLNDESETALMVHELAENFDFIMVGRRHRSDSPLLSGFSEFCELPELGPLGDMLASSDMQQPVSVLVVQRQLNRAEG